MSDKNNDEVLLRVEHLCQYFKNTKAVDDVSFDIKKGEVFGLVGESGCGKSTTGRAIIKIYDITSGSIYFKGQRVSAGTMSYKQAIRDARTETKKALKELQEDSKAHPGNRQANEEKAAQMKKDLETLVAENRKQIQAAVFDQRNSDKEYVKKLVEQVTKEYEEKCKEESDPAKLAELKKKFRDDLRVAKKTRLITKIQMIFQDPIASLNPRMTVSEILVEPLIISGKYSREEIEKKRKELLDTVGMPKRYANSYPHELDGGRRQRIGIGRALALEPDFIVCDEPVSALDVSIQAQILNLLQDLQEERGLTYMFITHDLSVVKHISHDIMVMYLGQMVEQAPSDELFAHTWHPYTKALLSAIPVPNAHKRMQRILLKGEITSPVNPAPGCRFYSRCPYACDECRKPQVIEEIVPGHFISCCRAREINNL